MLASFQSLGKVPEFKEFRNVYESGFKLNDMLSLDTIEIPRLKYHYWNTTIEIPLLKYRYWNTAIYLDRNLKLLCRNEGLGSLILHLYERHIRKELFCCLIKVDFAHLES